MTEKQIGKITHYYDKLKVGVIKLTDSLSAGDKIHIKGTHDDFEQGVESIQLDHKDVKGGKKSQEIAIKVNEKVHANDRVLRIEK